MKLTAGIVALAGTAYGFNVDTYVQDALDKIYTVNGDIHTVSFEPYFAAKCKVKGNGEKTGKFDVNCKGTTSNGGAKNKFTRRIVADLDAKKVTMVNTDDGNSDNLWLSEFWAPNQDLDFSVKDKLNVNWVDISKAQARYIRKGSVGAAKNMVFDTIVQLKQAGLKRGKYVLKAAVKGKLVLPAEIDLLPRSANWFGWTQDSSTQWNMALLVKAAQACDSAPFSQECDALIRVNGKAGDEKLAHSIRYTAAERKFSFGLKSPQKQCALTIEIASDDTRVAIHTQAIKPQRKKPVLVVQLPLPGALPGFFDAGEEFIQPFQDYIQKWFLGPFETYGFDVFKPYDIVAHAITYSDHFLGQLTDEFDCTALAKSTNFDSDLIADAIGAPTVQAFLAEKCVWLNEEAIKAINDIAIPEIVGARAYVNDLTGAAGKVQYRRWYKNNNL